MSRADKSTAALSRRWTHLSRAQQLARRAAMKRAEQNYMDSLKSKIPPKAREKLEWAFGKGFSAVFEYGDDIIEKSYAREKENRRHSNREEHIASGSASPALRDLESSAFWSDSLNMLLTTVEGVGLGALGVGMPDIVLFVAMILRGVREAAAQYGRSMDSESEQLLSLCMLETAMLSGEDWVERDALVERMMVHPDDYPPTPEAFDEQIQRTAAAFATDLLVLPFIQGLPIVGLVGGLSNPVYYRKVMNYVRLKYERAYVSELIARSTSK